MSDVPIGAFLSGGVDSSSVVALMSRHMGAPVKTYSVGFNASQDFNELKHARRVSEILGTDHHELVCDEPSPEVIVTVVRHLEEPIVDPAVLPTFMLSQLASKDVVVVLTGEGSDETNGGYSKYLYPSTRTGWPDRLLSRIPSSARRMATIRLAGCSGRLTSRIARRLARLSVFDGKFTEADSELWPRIEALDLFLKEFREAGNGNRTEPEKRDQILGSLAQSYFVSDMKGWLPNDLLMKVDRMSMAHSLEARVPFLDHRYVEFSLSIPWEMKLNGGVTKNLLRKAMKPLLPAETLYRQQHGFNVPLTDWFLGHWRPLVADLLGSRSLAERGYFNPKSLKVLRERVLSGDRGLALLGWAVMITEIWHREFIDSAGSWKR